MLRLFLSPDFLIAILRSTTPILFATLAAGVAAKAGICNMALEGITTSINSGTESVSDAAYQLGDAAVQQFLLTMSEENGSTIANSFVGGIVSVLDRKSVV